jgi:cytochrome P450
VACHFTLVPGGADLFISHHPQQLLLAKIDGILRDPTELALTPHPIIYHALLSPEANKGRPLPSRRSLLDEAGILLGAGADSTGITLMVTTHYVLQNPQVRQRLEAELREAWPVLEEIPRYEILEKLPYLVRLRIPGENGPLLLTYFLK